MMFEELGNESEGKAGIWSTSNLLHFRFFVSGENSVNTSPKLLPNRLQLALCLKSALNLTGQLSNVCVAAQSFEVAWWRE